jgi:transposase
MSEKRKHWTAEEKVAVLHKHLVEKAALSDVCEAEGLAPSQLYRWQKELFENGAAAFRGNGRGDGRTRKLEDENARLQAKLAGKDEVIAEIMAEHVTLKKSLGEA